MKKIAKTNRKLQVLCLQFFISCIIKEREKKRESANRHMRGERFEKSKTGNCISHFTGLFIDAGYCNGKSGYAGVRA